jgi:hypothetical protein
MYHLSLYNLATYTLAAIPLTLSLPALATGMPRQSDGENQHLRPALMAATFGQMAVPQNKFIAVAVPREGGYYNLLILEQISSRKPCWQEQGTSPTEIKPLLVNFDFTGICGRSTDSNGYSIRQAGKDLGLDYRLDVQKQGNDLVLLGLPHSSQAGQPLEIGRTHGIGSGLLKIHLNSGWQFAKRTYNGKTLGHVYLSSNQAQPPASLGRRLPPPREIRPSQRIPITPSSEQLRAIDIPVPDPNSEVNPPSGFLYRVVVQPRDFEQTAKIKSLVPDAFRSSYQGRSVMQVGRFNSRSKVNEIVKLMQENDLRPEVIEEDNDHPQLALVPPSSAANRPVEIPVPSLEQEEAEAEGRQFQSTTRTSNTLYRVVVRPRNSKQQSKIKSLVPDAFRSSYEGDSVMQVGLFDNEAKVDRMVKLMKDNGLKPKVIKESGQRLSLRTVPRPVGVLPVPGSRIPMGRADDGSDIYNLSAGLPPPPPNSSIALGPRYRVVVPTSSVRQRAKIKDLVPGAFRSSYQGRSVLQVGSFSSIQEAQDSMQLMESHGMNPILEKTP